MSRTPAPAPEGAGWDAQIWLTLQAKWDLWHALKARGRRPKVRPLRKTA
jgi:plasmid maintenance system antidote protein VapI